MDFNDFRFKEEYDICFVHDEEDVRKFRSGKCVIINTCGAEYAPCIMYDGSEDFLLKFCEKFQFMHGKYEGLNALAEWFLNFNIDRMIQLSQYCYKSDINQDFLKKYSICLKELERLCERYERSACVKFANVYMSYIEQLYRVNHGLKVEKDVVDMCQCLCRDSDFSGELRQSVFSLMADVYNNVIKDSATAQGYYSLTLSERTYCQRGIYWYNYNYNIRRALRCFNDALTSFHQCYEARFGIAMCYNFLGYYGRAMEELNTVINILNGKFENHVLECKDIIFLFNTYKYCGEINDRRLGDKQKGVEYYFLACKVFDEIDVSISECLKSELKQCLDINSIKSGIDSLNERIQEELLELE